MIFGAATITTPTKRKRKGDPRKHAPRYDVGGERLTAVEIAERAGIHRDTVLLRLDRGVRGAALLSPKYMGKHRRPISATRPSLLVAVKLARAFPDRVPSVKEIVQVVPMNRASAYRWRAALEDAA